jgi:hypothetical protein
MGDHKPKFLVLSDPDNVSRVLGVHALDQLKAYTFDDRTMRFSVRP